MGRNMKKRICVLLSALLLAAMLCACGAAPEKAVAGEWNWTTDLSDFMAAQIGDIEGLNMDPDTKVELFCKLTLNEDKTYHLTVNQAATEKSFAAYLESLKAAMVDYMYDMLGEGMDRETVNEMVKQSLGMTVEEYVDAAFAELDLESLLDELASVAEDGTFKVEEDKIYFPADSEDYFVFTLEKDTLTLESMSGNPMDFGNMIDLGMASFPQTLTR